MSKKPLRVLVCGGRDFTDAAYVVNRLFRLEEEYGDFTEVVHGGATGADSEAGRFAQLRHAKEIVFKANWKKHGKAAGPIRNLKMLEDGKPDLVVAFPGGRGTAHMVAAAKASGIKVIMA